MNRREFLLFSATIALIPGCQMFLVKADRSDPIPVSMLRKEFILETPYTSNMKKLKMQVVDGERMWDLCEGDEFRQEEIKSLEAAKTTCLWLPHLRDRGRIPTHNTWITRLH